MSNPTLRSLLALPEKPASPEEVGAHPDRLPEHLQGRHHAARRRRARSDQLAKLSSARRAGGTPVIHIQHDAGPGSPYDTQAPIGSIADIVAPHDAETVITKAYPSSFEKTGLDAELKRLASPIWYSRAS